MDGIHRQGAAHEAQHAGARHGADRHLLCHSGEQGCFGTSSGQGLAVGLKTGYRPGIDGPELGAMQSCCRLAPSYGCAAKFSVMVLAWLAHARLQVRKGLVCRCSKDSPAVRTHASQVSPSGPITPIQMPYKL
eukprot:363451-Chlamydomonas_euryale.AAC.12